MTPKELCEAMGYLSNPDVALKYDVQVPPKKQTEFESDYRNLTGVAPCSPGFGGYSVLGGNVDKRAVQYRISYLPIRNVPPCLQSISKPTPGTTVRKRISNKELLLKMFRSGFLLGAPPSRSRIISRIDPSCLINFEFGYTAAFSDQAVLRSDKFSEGFSAVDGTPQNDFSLYDEEAINLVHSVRAGRSAAFRHHVLRAYNHQCCICAGSLVDLTGVYETEAAHIVPKRLAGADDIRNGMALCRKHHWSFDRGMFWINEKYRVVVPKQILAINENASLGDYDGSLIQHSRDSNLAPHHSALAWHKEYALSRCC